MALAALIVALVSLGINALLIAGLLLTKKQFEKMITAPIAGLLAGMSGLDKPVPPEPAVDPPQGPQAL